MTRWATAKPTCRRGCRTFAQGEKSAPTIERPRGRGAAGWRCWVRRAGEIPRRVPVIPLSDVARHAWPSPPPPSVPPPPRAARREAKLFAGAGAAAACRSYPQPTALIIGGGLAVSLVEGRPTPGESGGGVASTYGQLFARRSWLKLGTASYAPPPVQNRSPCARSPQGTLFAGSQHSPSATADANNERYTLAAWSG